MNVLLFSTDPIALDATACRLMNLKPALVLTNQAGLEMGAGTYLEKDIELIGDPIEPFIAMDFDVNRKPEERLNKKNRMALVKNLMTSRPYIVAERCVHCGVCVQACPVNPKAVNWHDKNKSVPPTYQYNRCIRCYCCQELCPESAIYIKQPFFRRILGRK